jgi:DNA/RNA endonuclease YhcR with UshA esterase domain
MKCRISRRVLLAIALSIPFTSSVTHAADALDPADAASHVGKEVTVCGEVTGAKFSDHRKRKPTFIDFGPPHPNQLFTVLIWGEYRDKFEYVPESLLGKTICVSGTITEYKGKAEIKVTDPAQIEVVGD